VRAICDLEQWGYTFTLNGDDLCYTYDGEHPDPAQVRPLLEYVRQHRDEAVAFLLERQRPATWDAVTLSLPGDTSLAVPADPARWKRENDRIVATYTRPELQTAVALALEQMRERLEARLERGLEVMGNVTGCDDADAEALLAQWGKLNAVYVHVMGRLEEVMN